MALTTHERERDGLRRRPDKRPVGRGDRDGDAVAFGKGVADVVDLNAHRQGLVRRERCRGRAVRRAGEVENAVMNPG